MMYLDLARLLRVVPPLLIALAIGSCGPAKNQFAPACPVPGLLKPLSDLVRYRAGSVDIRDLVVRARIVNVTGTCEPGDDANIVVAKAQLVLEAQRGPGMTGDAISVPAFIAITEGDTVLDKVTFNLAIEFQRNVDTTTAMSREVRMEIPITPQKSGAAYGIVGGFQLTPEEVAAWRNNNRR
jgi:hypothetical protein